jgi:hypothetical protein
MLPSSRTVRAFEWGVLVVALVGIGLFTWAAAFVSGPKSEVVGREDEQESRDGL